LLSREDTLMTIGNDIERDIALVGHLDAVSKILQVL
jgi:hypothetical protein